MYYTGHELFLEVEYLEGVGVIVIWVELNDSLHVLGSADIFTSVVSRVGLSLWITWPTVL